MITREEWQELTLSERLLEHYVRIETSDETHLLRGDLLEAHRRLLELENLLTNVQAELLRLEQIHSVY
jgi:hypothetical protein